MLIYDSDTNTHLDKNQNMLRIPLLVGSNTNCSPVHWKKTGNKNQVLWIQFFEACNMQYIPSGGLVCKKTAVEPLELSEKVTTENLLGAGTNVCRMNNALGTSASKV